MKKENRIFPVAALAALVINFLICQDAAFKIPVLGAVLLICMLVAVNVLAAMRKASRETRSLLLHCSFMTIVCFVLIHLVCLYRVSFMGNGRMISTATTVLAVLFLLGTAVFLLRTGEVTEDSVFLLLFAALLVRIFYVVLTQAHIYQNDAGALIPDYGGHLGYMYYIYSHNGLPDFDPRIFNQFYHPPLHYIIGVLWMKFNMLFGMKIEAADECLQVLSLFYTTATLGFLNKIGIRLRISCMGRWIALGFIAFLPYSIMMAGNINNDALMTLFVVMALYFTLKWYEEPSLKNILLIAVTIGCAMMTKLSGGLVEPAVAAVMLLKAWKERKSRLGYLRQFVCFGVVVFPLGLWFPIKNLLLYGVPLTYVPRLEEESGQFIGYFSKLQRLFGTEGQLNTLCINWDRYEPDISFNIPLSLVKFSVFGEGNYYLCNETVKRLGTWMFYLTLILFAVCMVFTLIWLFLRSVRVQEKICLLLAAVVILASYVKFCFAYPHVCTMHVRYIMVPLFVGFLCMGGVLSGIRKRPAVAGCLLAVLLYGIMSVLLMVNLEVLLA